MADRCWVRSGKGARNNNRKNNSANIGIGIGTSDSNNNNNNIKARNPLPRLSQACADLKKEIRVPK